MYLCDPLLLDALENLLEFSAVFSGEGEQWQARTADGDAEQFAADLHFLQIAAAFDTAKEGHEFVHAGAGGDEVFGERGFEHVVMVQRSAGGGAADPCGGAPQEVVEGLVVGAADDLVAVAVAFEHAIDAGHIAGGFFDADDVVVFGETVHHVEADFGACAPGEVVQHDGNFDGFGDGFVMREQFALVGT